MVIIIGAAFGGALYRPKLFQGCVLFTVTAQINRVINRIKLIENN